MTIRKMRQTNDHKRDTGCIEEHSGVYQARAKFPVQVYLVMDA
jgi:hypothetical protein